MKKKIVLILLAIIILIVAIVVYKSLVKTKMNAVLPDKVVEINGDKEFPGPDWGLKSIICKQGGFDILAHAGKEITIEKSLAIGKFYQATPLDLFTVYADGKVICKYYVDSAGLLTPGIFAINDPGITGQ